MPCLAEQNFKTADFFLGENPKTQMMESFQWKRYNNPFQFDQSATFQANKKVIYSWSTTNAASY